MKRLVSALGIFALVLTAQAKIKVLTYDSFAGKYGMGPWIATEFKKTYPSYEIEWVTTKELSNLYGQIKKDSKAKSQSYQAVLGLDASSYMSAHDEKILGEGFLFDQSPFALIYDSKRVEGSLPKSWKDLKTLWAGQVLIENPALSTPGQGWLRAIYEFKLLSKEDSKKITKRIFPSWSSAYDAFLKGEGWAVWSYQTSEAYHRCNEKKEEDRNRYLALSLDEGYPQNEEWVAPLQSAASNKEVLSFIAFMKGGAVQRKAPELNWMLPGIPAGLPKCYDGLTKVKTHSTGHLVYGPEILKTWIEEWSL